MVTPAEDFEVQCTTVSLVALLIAPLASLLLRAERPEQFAIVGEVGAVNAGVTFPGSAEVKVPTMAVGFGGQPLSDVGISGQVERDLRRLFAGGRGGGLSA